MITSSTCRSTIFIRLSPCWTNYLRGAAKLPQRRSACQSKRRFRPVCESKTGVAPPRDSLARPESTFRSRLDARGFSQLKALLAVDRASLRRLEGYGRLFAALRTRGRRLHALPRL